MATYKATVDEADGHHFIRIDIGANIISIPISQDKPTQVKEAFNELITLLRKGRFEIEMDQAGDDLFSQVGKEYVAQLSRELAEVYGEMKGYGLVEE